MCSVSGARRAANVSAAPRGGMVNATRGGRAARKECRWKLAGRPQGISLEGGRAKTPRTPKTPRTVAGWASRLAIGLREARSRRKPRSLWGLALQAGAVLGVLGVLGVLAKALEREAAKCLPGHRPAAKSAKRPSACPATVPPPRARRGVPRGIDA